MELKELMAAFAAETGAPGCAPDENGAYNLAIDDIAMMIEPYGDGSICAFNADLGEPPAEGREQVYRALLEASFPQDGGMGATLSLNAGNGRICLRRVEPIGTADYEAFKKALEAFVNAAEDWRRKLADFPALFEKVQDIVAESEGEARSLASSGFLQV